MCNEASWVHLLTPLYYLLHGSLLVNAGGLLQAVSIIPAASGWVIESREELYSLERTLFNDPSSSS